MVSDVILLFLILCSEDPSTRPLIAEANKHAPTFAKIYKEMIIFASGSKPFPRAAKGTVIRKRTMALYADEINILYVIRVHH